MLCFTRQGGISPAKNPLAAVLVLLILLFGFTAASTEVSSFSADYHVMRAKKFLHEDRTFEAMKEFREALRKDDSRPEIHGYLSMLLYELGFLDEAIEEMRTAVALSPEHVYLNMELGKLHFAGHDTEDALEQFFRVLELNPGHANAYYYLGELLLSIKEYDLAWMSAKMALRAGHSGQDLMNKLRSLSEEPMIEPWKRPGQELYVRQILVSSLKRANELVKRILEGELFEDIAFGELTGPAALVGGYLGKMDPSDLHPDIARELLASEVLSPPSIVETESGYHIVQRLLPFDFSYWKNIVAAHRETTETEETEAEAETEASGRESPEVEASKVEKSDDSREEEKPLPRIGESLQ